MTLNPSWLLKDNLEQPSQIPLYNFLQNLSVRKKTSCSYFSHKKEIVKRNIATNDEALLTKTFPKKKKSETVFEGEKIFCTLAASPVRPIHVSPLRCTSPRSESAVAGASAGASKGKSGGNACIRICICIYVVVSVFASMFVSS